MCQDFDEAGFKAAVERHWKYHRPCRHRLWSSERLEDGKMKLSSVPVFQEILGGDQDGLQVWTAYEMNLTDFFAEPGIEVNEVGFRSLCIECTPNPFVGIRGRYKGHPFILTIYMQPIDDTEPVEIIDTINNQTRAVKGRKS
jgi:hypothetical protein